MTTDSVNEDAEKFAPGAVVFNSFTVISSIGHGGMGSVYKVHHEMLDVDMALKVLNKGSASGADFIRFQNEAKTLSKLSHNHVARVYDFGLDDGTPYLAMDFIEGQTLEQYLEQHGTLSITEFIVIFSQICSGLAHAHSRNTIHRDLKPGNIILSEDDNGNIRAVIVDFGVAKLQEEMQVGQLTQAGAFIGSPLCCSPEQIEGGLITPAADMYALGCTMFDALTGEFPFRGESVIETLSMHRDMDPPLEKLSADIPVRIREAVAALLEKDPAERKWSATELGEALDSGHLIRQSEDAVEIDVTIPPRLRRIESNEATAARIKLNYELPAAAPSKVHLPKKELLIVVSGLAACGAIVALYYFTNIVPAQNDATKGSGPLYSPMVEAAMDYIDKDDKKASQRELAILGEEPEFDQVEMDYEAALSSLRAQKFTKASQQLNDFLKKMGSKDNLGKIKRVDILGNLAACAYLQGKTADYEKYFKQYLKSVPESGYGGQVIHLAKEIAGYYVLSKNSEGAFRTYRHFLDIEEAKRYPEIQGCLLDEIGKAEAQRGNKDAAFKAFNQSINIFRSTNQMESIYYLDALTALGGLEFLNGKSDDARLHLEEVERLVPEGDEEGPFKDQRALLILSSRMLLDLDLKKGNLAKAREHAERGQRLTKMLNRPIEEKAFADLLHNLDLYEEAIAKQASKGHKTITKTKPP